jgi:proteasome accessory factor B
MRSKQMKLSRISRIIKLLTTLQSSKQFSVEELIEHIGVSRRTFFRDLKVLQEVGVPYRFNLQTGTYSVDPEFFLPSVDLNMPEALALLMLVHEGAKHLPLPFQSSAMLGGLKIENNLPAEIQKYCNATLESISIKPDSHAPMETLDNVFWLLQRAAHRKHKVKMSYHSVYDKANIKITLNPYHIHYNNRAWYVIGHSSIHKEVRTFKLNRIEKLEVLDSCFIADKNFGVDGYFGKAWSMIPEGKIYHVELLFSARVARNVTEVHWHSTQKVTHNDDGTTTLEFRVDGIGEIAWWVLGYGDQVEVIKPAALRKRIAQTAKKVVKLNS